MSKRRAWFRVSDSVLWDGWSDAELATMVRLLAYMNTRWARDGKTTEEACEVTLTPGALRLVTRRQRRDHGLLALSSLKDRVTLTVRSVGDNVELKWPKYAIFQGLKPGSQATTRPEFCPTPPQPHTQPLPHKDAAPIAEPEEPSGASAPAPATKELVLVESTDVSLQPPLPCAPERLLNVLAKRPGTVAAKRAWLYDTLPLIVCEVVALGLETQQQRNAKLVSFVIRWWNQECRSPGGRRPAVESFDERAQRQRDEWLHQLTQEASA